MGRGRTHFSTQAAIVQAILRGKMTIAEAAAQAGVKESAVKRWLSGYKNATVIQSLGRGDYPELPPKPPPPPPPQPKPAPAKPTAPPPPPPPPKAAPARKGGL